MASRILRLHIVAAAARLIAVPLTADLLLGAVAPDGAHDQVRSHVKGVAYSCSDGTPIQVGRFLRRYVEHEHSDYFRGYVSHLVADALWTHVLFFSGLKSHLRQHAWPVLYDAYPALARHLVVEDDLAVWKTLLSTAGNAPALTELTTEEAEAARRATLTDVDAMARVAGDGELILPPVVVAAYCERAAASSADTWTGWGRRPRTGVTTGASGSVAVPMANASAPKRRLPWARHGRADTAGDLA